MTDETAYHGTIFLLDPNLVVAAVRPGPGELDAMVGTVLEQCLVDERAVVIRVDTVVKMVDFSYKPSSAIPEDAV